MGEEERSDEKRREKEILRNGRNALKMKWR